ncbi:MAG: class I SAM-dependent methyltransferase [Dehalococcoidia bacterium]
MYHGDHLQLLRGGIPGPGGVWADMGCGAGAFTLALADLAGPGVEIHAVDRDAGALRSNAIAVRERFPGAKVEYLEGDFTRPLALPELDGIVMANSLHFQDDQVTVVRLLRTYLRPGGRLIIVEYNIDRANYAVPHPVPFTRWERLARDAGFDETTLLYRRPARSSSEIYSAMST